MSLFVEIAKTFHVFPFDTGLPARNVTVKHEIGHNYSIVKEWSHTFFSKALPVVSSGDLGEIFAKFSFARLFFSLLTFLFNFLDFLLFSDSVWSILTDRKSTVFAG